METTSNYIIISVSSISQRDAMINNLINKVDSDPTDNLIVEKDQNKVKVYHRVDTGVRVLIRVYVVVVIPVQVNLQPLTGFSGKINFCLDETIDALTKILKQLKAINGYKEIKASGADRTLQQLMDILS